MNQSERNLATKERCCYSLLLEVDGLSLEWTKELGMHDEIDVQNNVSNFALERLQRANVDVRTYDLSGMGPGDDIVRESYNESSDTSNDEYDNNLPPVRIVCNMSMKAFRQKLIEHFEHKMDLEKKNSFHKNVVTQKITTSNIDKFLIKVFKTA